MISKEDLQALFDLVVGSMDYGSGFLDSDDIAVLRRAAKALVVETKYCTPREFARNFNHTYEDHRYAPGSCRLCSGAPTANCHKGLMEEDL